MWNLKHEDKILHNKELYETRKVGLQFLIFLHQVS